MYEKYGFMIGASATISSKPIFETIHFLPRSHPQCVQFVFALTSHWSVGKPICLIILQRRPFHLCLKSKMISWANVLYCFFLVLSITCSKQNINSQDPLSSFVLNAVFNTVSLLSLYQYMFKAGYQLSGPPFFSCSRPWPSPSPGRPTS